MMTGIALTIGTMSFAAVEPQAEQTAMQSYQAQNDYGFINVSFDCVSYDCVNVDVDFIDIDFAADIELDRVYETQTLSYVNIVLRANSSENLVGYIDQFRLCGSNSNFDNFSTPFDVLLKGNITLITPC
jgi:hypothetical protein